MGHDDPTTASAECLAPAEHALHFLPILKHLKLPRLLFDVIKNYLQCQLNYFLIVSSLTPGNTSCCYHLVKTFSNLVS